LDADNGDPLMIRSDFHDLDDNLDATLDNLHQQIVLFDVDGDNRLRPDHPFESLGLIGQPDLVDHDGNEYVDDFDLFVSFYDANGDGWVVYDQLLANDAGHGMPAEEFTDIDDQLAWLIDEAYPDRDGDGFVDEAAGSGDRMLGYRDGILDVRDLYAKVRGRLAFSVTRDAWEVAHGESYQTVVHGPIQPGPQESPVTFGLGDDGMRELSADMFQTAATWFEAQVPIGSADFDAQVAAGQAAGGTYTPPDSTTWESVPYRSPGPYDHYQRPVYQDMRFENVRIPTGNNGLFQRCTFVGVTFIETETDCVHENWNYVGAVERFEDPPGSGNYFYEPKYPGLVAELSDGTVVPDTKVLSNSIRYHDCTFIGSIAGDTPGEFTHWRNHVQFTGETRFYVSADDPDLDEQPDKIDIIAEISALDEAFLAELRKSSILMPGWSAGVGNHRSDQPGDPADDPKVKLTGTIVAGIIDIRGTVDLFGTLLLTFRPTADEGPLFYGGHPSLFKSAIGYVGPVGVVGPGHYHFPGFGEITLRYDPQVPMLDGIPWAIRAQPYGSTRWSVLSPSALCD
jgi:hypothetical protein